VFALTICDVIVWFCGGSVWHVAASRDPAAAVYSHAAEAELPKKQILSIWKRDICTNITEEGWSGYRIIPLFTQK
jgi:hypothetical protein